jgi:hypothetical protein
MKKWVIVGEVYMNTDICYCDGIDHGDPAKPVCKIRERCRRFYPPRNAGPIWHISMPADMPCPLFIVME